MRSVNATLHAALQAGTGTPYLKGYVGYTDGSVKTSHTNLIAYKLTGTRLDLWIPSQANFAGDQDCIWLERGLTIAGTTYTVTTGRFFITEENYMPDGVTHYAGRLFPPEYYSAAGDVSYDTAITAFCTAYGKTAVYKDDTEAWLAYQFLPTGKSILMNNAIRFLNLLQQKRLISCHDNGSEEVRFYSADVFGASQATIAVKDEFVVMSSTEHSRQYIWRDEADTIHQDGALTDPIHNLGYLESTDSPPARNTATYLCRALIRPDLRLQDGDALTISFAGGSKTVTVLAIISEEYDSHSTKLPKWRTIIEANPIFNSTEGGALPSTIERVSNYTPLNTSLFDNVLDENDNNLQAAMETLDEHVHLGRDAAPAHGHDGTIAAGATMYLTPFDGGLNAGYRANWVLNGIFQVMRVKMDSAQPASGSLVFTLQINDVDTAIVLTVPASGTAISYVNSTDTATVYAGNLVRVKIKNNATAASGQIGGLGLQCRYNTTQT